MTNVTHNRIKQALLEQLERAREGKLDPEKDKVIIEYLKELDKSNNPKKNKKKV